MNTRDHLNQIVGLADSLIPAPLVPHSVISRIKEHALAALEAEAEPVERERFGWQLQHGVTVAVCPDCAFSFDAEHEDQETGGYSCPNCCEVHLPALTEQGSSE